MKIGILGASFDTGNMGVSVLAAGAIDNSLSQYPGADVYLVDYGRQSGEVWVTRGECKSRHMILPLRFSKYLVQRNNVFLLTGIALACRLIPRRIWREALLRRNAVLNELMETDVFVSIAGGDSFSDVYGFVRLLYVGLPQILVLLINRKLTLLPQTIGPFSSSAAKAVAKFILRRSDRVYTRDFAGISFTRRIAHLTGREADKVQFSFDLGFKVPPAPMLLVPVTGFSDGVLTDHRTVGVNISGLLWNHGFSFGIVLDYRRLIQEIITYFVEVARVPVLLIPHVSCPGNPDSDDEAVNEVADLFRGRYERMVGVLGSGLSYDETKYVIGCFDYFIGARMHACIAALSQAVPCSALAYSGKFEGVMASVGAEEITIDLRSVDVETAMGRIQCNYENRSSLREKLAQTMPAVKVAVATV